MALPHAAEPPPGKPTDRSGTALGHAAAAVLLCDDDDSLRRVLTDHLQSLGHIVYGANDADAALRILETRGDIDLLIMDYDMPDMNGLETIRQARLRRPDLRWLLITGHAAIPSSFEIPVLHKPFTADELGRRTAELLAARRSG